MNKHKPGITCNPGPSSRPWEGDSGSLLLSQHHSLPSLPLDWVPLCDTSASSFTALGSFPRPREKALAQFCSHWPDNSPSLSLFLYLSLWELFNSIQLSWSASPVPWGRLAITLCLFSAVQPPRHAACYAAIIVKTQTVKGTFSSSNTFLQILKWKWATHL